MIRRRSNLIAFVATAALAFSISGCRGGSGSPAAAVPEATPFVPRLIKQQGSPELLELKASDVPGLVMVEVKNVELPGILETSGQVTYDDRRVSTIVSRVQGRIEETRVSLWDSVSRGEKIVALYSPDFMTAE